MKIGKIITIVKTILAQFLRFKNAREATRETSEIKNEIRAN
jgi:hypothetical protein